MTYYQHYTQILQKISKTYLDKQKILNFGYYFGGVSSYSGLRLYPLNLMQLVLSEE